jgi:hypothetical protein
MNNFQINRASESQKVCDNIKDFIEQALKKEDFKSMVSQISSCLDIPESVIKLKLKRLFGSKHDYKKRKFKIQSSYFEIILNYCISIILLIINVIPKPKQKIKSFDLIIDDINELEQASRFYKIVSKLNSSLMIIRPHLKGKKPIFKKINNKNLNKIKNNFFLKSKVNINSNFNVVKLLNKYLILSLKNRIDFSYFLRVIITSYLKYSSIFETNKSKYLIQDKFFETCSIKNYLFKKKGGRFSCCTQIHLVESTLGLFTDIDVFFSFGKETDSLNKFNKLGGRVAKSIPVGSHKMEQLWHNKNKDLKKKKDIDILIIGINPTSWFNISDEMRVNLFEFLKWIKKISIKNPKYNIIYKHHPNFPENSILDNEENEILKNSYVKKVIKSSNMEINTYDYMNRSKIILSYGSSMIVEGISEKKNCFFVSPHKNTEVFFNDLQYLNKIIIKNYDDLKIKIKLILEDNKNVELLNDEICLNSQNVSDKIIKFLNTQ